MDSSETRGGGSKQASMGTEQNKMCIGCIYCRMEIQLEKPNNKTPDCYSKFGFADYLAKRVSGFRVYQCL